MKSGIIIVLWLLCTGLFSAVTIKKAPSRYRETYVMESDTVLTGEITILHQGDAADFFITLSSGQSGDVNNRKAVNSGVYTLNYRFETTAGDIIQDLTVSPTYDHILTGSFPASSGKQTLKVSFYLVLPGGQFPAEGSFLDSVQITLYQGNLSSWILRESSLLTMEFISRKRTELSIVPSGMSFDSTRTTLSLDWGIIEDNESRGFDFIVRSNAMASVTLKSRNGGSLNSPGSGDNIFYTLTVRGSPVDLSSGQSVVIIPSLLPTSFTGEAFPVVITVGSMGMVTEGQYSDELTLSVIAR